MIPTGLLHNLLGEEQVMSDQSTVEWREVTGWPGYRASSEGIIETQWIPGEKFVKGHKHRRAVRGSEWRSIRPHRDHFGYLAFNIPTVASPIRKRASVKVHVFVCLAFHGLPQPGQEVRHFPDRDQDNNRADNLSWGTHAQNVADRECHGTVPRGEGHQFSKLTFDKVMEIHRLSASGWGPKAIAEKIGGTPSNVSNIIAFRAWSWVRENVTRERELAAEVGDRCGRTATSS